MSLAAPANSPKSRIDAAQPVILIGSRRDCDIYVDSSDVSKTHCAIVNDGSTIIAFDLCSRTGTFVNGAPLSGPVELRRGDELRVGSVDVAIEIQGGESRHVRSSGKCGKLETPLVMGAADHRFELLALPAVIGRRQACQIVLDTPDVSLSHALIFLIEGRPAIVDLGSRSGTVLNSQRVDIAWLRSGDQLTIGGEKLAVDWEGPQYHAGDFNEVEDAITAQISAASVSANLGNPTDIGAMIDGLKARIDASQGDIRKRAAELDKRAGDLNARELELNRVRDELDGKRDELELLTKGVGEKHEELDVRAAALEQEREDLLAERRAFEHQRAEYDGAIAELSSREAELSERLAALEARENELAPREEALARREAEAADVQARIDSFKSALNEAQKAFGGAVPGGGAAPRSPSNASKRSERKAAFPAPLVDEPIFDAVGSAITADWTPEMFDRLKALRRVNGKAEAELISQVQAEFATRSASTPVAESAKKKRKRRWLS